MALLDLLMSRLGRVSPAHPAFAPESGRSDGRGVPETALERVLATLEVGVRSLAICEVEQGDSLAIPAMPRPFIHYVLTGTGRLEVEGAGELSLRPHSFVVLPPARRQTIVSAGPAGRRVEAFEQPGLMVDHMIRISSGRGGVQELVTTCGTIEASYGGSSTGLFDSLRDPVALSLQPAEPLRLAFEAMLQEFATPRLGSRALTEAMLKQCLILLVRRMAPDAIEHGWPLGTTDPGLVRAVLALVDNPAADFTVEGLAELAGMSRSRFAAVFQEAFATTPIELLKRIRLQQAARLLARTDLPVSVIARSIGYASRTYFSRAFAERYGINPRRYRSRQLA